MGTRTYTRYFENGSLDRLKAESRILREDASRRASYIEHDALSAIFRRLDMLDTAIDLLGEAVPEAYGG